MELRRVNDIDIKKIVLHVLDKNSEEPLLNEQEVELTGPVLEFIGGHLIKLLADEDNIKAKFFNERGVVYSEVHKSLADEDFFISSSQLIAGYLFRVIKQYDALPSCDLVCVNFLAEGTPAFAIIKLDYQRSIEHAIDYIEDRFQIQLAFQETALPDVRQKIACGAVMMLPNTDYYDIVAVERIVKGLDGEPIEFFIKEFLQANRVVDHIDKTKLFHKNMENWLRKNVRNEMDKAIGIREDLQDIYRNSVDVNVQEIANDIIDDTEKREKFIESMEVVGFDTEEPFELDKHFIEKKLKSKSVRTDTGFVIRGVTDLYLDPSKFEIKYNGDGTVNYIIKNVRNISER